MWLSALKAFYSGRCGCRAGILSGHTAMLLEVNGQVAFSRVDSLQVTEDGGFDVWYLVRNY